MKAAWFCRGLILCCITTHYADLWQEGFQKEFNLDTWAKPDPRLPNTFFSNLTPHWQRNCALRTDYARRQALVEIDALAAMAIGLTIDELKTIYRVQFPVLRQNENDTWYDRIGRIVFTCSKGLTGVGFSRPEWNDIKDMPSGTVERTIIDNTLSGGPIERTITYEAPFDGCDRERDVDYFFRPATVAIAGIEFRKRSRLTKKEEERIKFQTIDFIQKYLEIEEILNEAPVFKNPVTRSRIKSHEDIERAALEIREKWNLGNGPVPHLIEPLEDNGFKIFEVEAEGQFDGLSGFTENMAIPVIAVYKNADLVRKRLTIAHEMGNLLLDFSGIKNSSSEKLCHAFADALLLPRETMLEKLGQHRNKITLWELKKLKGNYGVSMQAIMARALHLRIISENTYRKFNIYVNKHGWRKSEPGNFKGKEEASRFKQLIVHAAAEQIISFSKAADLLNQSLEEFEREIQIIP